ncbi:hypothetical protein [Shinella pollutisoli]|uniref:Uncharacterized protein n=1 Tax=Shinella pollutisoli TaxID=2250594 RepID=A0ABV7DQ66_9HYPH|nr:hypothetical protein [Shinella pollutisoli]
MTDIDLVQATADVVEVVLSDGRKIPCGPVSVEVIEILLDGEPFSPPHIFWTKAAAALAMRDAKRTLKADPRFIPRIGGRRDA